MYTWVSDKFSALASSFLSCPTTYWFRSKAWKLKLLDDWTNLNNYEPSYIKNLWLGLVFRFSLELRNTSCIFYLMFWGLIWK